MELLLQKVSVLRDMLRVILDMVSKVQTCVGRKRNATQPCGAQGMYPSRKFPVLYLHNRQGYRHAGAPQLDLRQGASQYRKALD